MPHTGSSASKTVASTLNTSSSPACADCTTTARAELHGFRRTVVAVFVAVIVVVLAVVVVGEWLGLLDQYTERVPPVVGVAVVLVAAYPILRSVVRAALRRRVTSHTLMSTGLVAALLIGEWITALLVVFFMHLAEYVERFTTSRARRAIVELSTLAPRSARVERGGGEELIPIDQVRTGDIVVVRPGEQIPVDGDVESGSASVNQATITGEAIPIDAAAGTSVFAASTIQAGMLRVRATRVGEETTFGHVVQLVSQATRERGELQRLADRFSTYYLPTVAVIAFLTFAFSKNVLATAAVLVVACSCSFALATPIAVLAATGAAARSGVLIKGGKYLEALAACDTVLVDKTGTLTMGQPAITDIATLESSAEEILTLAAAAEHYSEHPLAEAVRRAARRLAVPKPAEFQATPGVGVRAVVNGHAIIVRKPATGDPSGVTALQEKGETVLVIERDGLVIGALGVSDTLRPEAIDAVRSLRNAGLHIELLTGDHPLAARAVAEPLGIGYRADLLPDEKIRIVTEYQAAGHRVMMIGDGVNDAPALAQADVGVTLGAAASPIALETADISLLRDDWYLVPAIVELSRRTLRIVKGNIGFTAVYNILGLLLAATGLLPPVLAAAAQSLPDVLILGNSSRLLR